MLFPTTTHVGADAAGADAMQVDDGAGDEGAAQPRRRPRRQAAAAPVDGGDPSRPLRLLAAGLSGVDFDGEREGYRNGSIASSTEELLHWPWPRRADEASTDFDSLLHEAAAACGVDPADADDEVVALRARRERRDASAAADAATASAASACYGGALPWTERYRPESVGEFRCRSGGVPGTDAAKLGGVVALDLWLNEWKEKMQNEKESDTRRTSQNSWVRHGHDQFERPTKPTT